MAVAKELKMVILLESEIRKAAIMMRAAARVKEDTPKEQIWEIYKGAILACMNALRGAEEPGVILVLGSDNMFK